ncbi:hypothetical protein ACNKHR_26825 [Shigella flexneri]
MIKTTLLFFVTALCKIIQFFIATFMVQKQNALSGCCFRPVHWRCLWLLTLHPAASGRVYAGLWWRLCLHGVDVAARCGWREETDSL